MKHFLFKQIDTWFFRESRNMDGSGAVALSSIFPPANNTLLGAIRSRIGEQYNDQNSLDWSAFSAESELAQIIGYAQNYAELQAQGAWLYNEKEQQLYFRCPMNILKQQDGFDYFKLGSPINCDLGNNVLLPELDYAKEQSPMENMLISASAFSHMLSGGDLSDDTAIISIDKIISDDYRLGISRNNEMRKVIDGKLYQTNHIRLNNDWCMYLGLSGVQDKFKKYIPNNTLLRLGGESRMAELINLSPEPSLPSKPCLNEKTRELIIYLLTPLPDFDRTGFDVVTPNDSFQKVEDESSKETYWKGSINNVELEIISAIVGKPERIGGWDMVKHQSTPVRSFIPAGSCWYVRVDNQSQAENIVESLHCEVITSGNDRALGYGQIVVGIAPNK